MCGSLSAALIPAAVWIDGSFMTQKIDPADVDLAVRLSYAALPDPGAEQQALFARIAAKHFGGCDSYVFVEYPAGLSTACCGRHDARLLAAPIWVFAQRCVQRHGGDQDAVCMSAFLDLRNLLQETSATLERLEREIAKSPRDWGLAITADFLRRRQTDLEGEFAAIANLNLLDVCDYRLIPSDNGDYPIISVTRALASFQELVTTVFDAFKTQPKVRARFTADVVAASTLSFGYAYPGSLGFVLTMPNERLLLGESDLDRAIQTIFEMAKSEQPN